MFKFLKLNLCANFASLYWIFIKKKRAYLFTAFSNILKLW